VRFLGKFLSSVVSRLLSGVSPVQRSLASSGVAYYEVGPGCQVENMGGLLEKYLGIRDEGFFVEVGAFDGVTSSNSIGLVRRGWGGVAVEPNDSSAEQCRENYRPYPNVSVEQVAIGQRGQRTLVLRSAGTLSSSSLEMNELYQRLHWSKPALTEDIQKVKCIALDELLERYSPNEIDLLVVDVEGTEEDVFAGFSIDKWRPKVIVVELTENHPDFLIFKSSDSAVYRFILNSNYVVAYKDSINTVFVDTTIYWSKNL